MIARPAYFFLNWEVPAHMRNWIFVKVETEDLSVLLIGQDPRRIEHLWQIMHRQYFWRGGIYNYTAISGIDQALWDIN